MLTNPFGMNPAEKEYDLLPEFEIQGRSTSQSGGSLLDGEIVLLSRETPMSYEDHLPGPRITSLRMRNDPPKPPVHARILWPALGFPAVINPKPEKPYTQGMECDCDATCCICVLILSDRKILSKEEASRFLRYVPWNQRGRRYIEAGQEGSFEETALSVYNNVFQIPGGKDLHGTGIMFGGNCSNENGITVKLSNAVMDFYKSTGLQYLHEIRIGQRASGKLSDGQYHLFWNNESNFEKTTSSEMRLLIDKFAIPRRSTIGNLWKNTSAYLLNEYEFEYGSHPPYNQKLTRAEILHPLFVKRSPSANLRVGHITDSHVAVRPNVYEYNLFKKPGEVKQKINFNNWNKNFENSYRNARKDSDILLLTGDLIDYGRGHWGPFPNESKLLGNDHYYHVDRNWFLFYYLLASGDAYEKPVYTILGNHDWRVNPYPPFAPGAPGFNSMFHNHRNIPNKNDRRSILKTAHDAGWDRTYSYQLDATGTAGLTWAIIKDTFSNGNLRSKLPIATTVESVKWYLLSINPFLDYSCSLPDGQKLLMLDWAEKEDLFFEESVGGKEFFAFPWTDAATMPGPKAGNMLTGLQKRIVESFVSSPGNAKIIGMHAPAIGPYPDWSDNDLLKGVKVYEKNERGRGPRSYGIKYPDGSVVPLNGHPFFAVLPSNDDMHYGTVADYNSFQKDRTWFLQKMAQPGSGVRLIFAGHIHRNGLFAIHTPTKEERRGDALTGKMLVKSFYNPGQPVSLRGIKFNYPLYVNTTSAGPRGNYYKQKLTASEERNGGLSVEPGFAKIDLSNTGVIGRVKFEDIPHA